MSTKNPNKAKRYTQDFIDGALKMVDTGMSNAEVAKALGINDGAVYYWKKKRSENPQNGRPSASQGAKTASPAEDINALKEENQRLRNDLRKVTEQRDLLKKTLQLYVQ